MSASPWRCTFSLCRQHAGAAREDAEATSEAGSSEDARPVTSATLTFVDLAGSERVSTAALEDSNQRARLLEVGTAPFMRCASWHSLHCHCQGNKAHACKDRRSCNVGQWVRLAVQLMQANEAELVSDDFSDAAGSELADASRAAPSIAAC